MFRSEMRRATRTGLASYTVGAALSVLLLFSSLWTGVAFAQDNDPDSYKQVLNQYCLSCHNDALLTANLSFTNIDLQNVDKHADVWEKVLLKLKTRSMPPVGMPRPDEDFYVSMGNYLEENLNTLAQENPNPGKNIITHRLNRTEYSNVIRDLLAVQIDSTELLPPDNSGDFDNLGDLLSVSPLLMEKYMNVAYLVSRLAIGDISLGMDSEEYEVSAFLMQNDRMDEDLPFGTRGGIAVKHRFPLDGEYEIAVRLFRTDGTGLVVGTERPHRLDVRVDGKRIDLLTVGGENVNLALGSGRMDKLPPSPEQAQYERLADSDLKIRFQAKAGERTIQVAFLEENFAWEGQIPPRSYDNYYTARLREDYERAWTPPSVSNVTVTGPFTVNGVGNTASREKIFICTPSNSKEEEPCAKKIFAGLARNAYRRPVTDEDINPLMDLYREGVKQGGTFDSGIQMGLEGLLVSTEFLFRVHKAPEKVVENSNYSISDIELASRLSFFIWSSIPDNELLTLAERDRLSEPAVLAAQVKRMLKDERSQSLVNNFAAQWLLLRNLPHTNKNQELFPEFDEGLRQDFQKETQLFIASIFQDDRSILDLFRADYKYLNERLARHYDIPDVFGNRFRRVNVNDENKKGLLAHGSVLAITSYPNRTSPVLRGKWVLENILASPPPPPPTVIPPLEEKGDDGKVLSMRAAIEKHRANPVCAVCHNRMDPIGFGLENFNPIGQWRTVDAGDPIDSSGMLPDGVQFQGPAELQDALLQNSEVIANAFTQKLLIYALGRDLEYFDMPVVRDITGAAAQSDYRFSEIVIGIVNSLPFKMRRTDS